jgi:predicted protein tyrosine phosphatase
MTDSPQRINVLFVCSKNQWRSPTAEKIYERDDRLNVRSRGTSENARQTVRSTDIIWADMIFVMEHKQEQRLSADYPDGTRYKELHVLDIPDDYRFMDPELVELLQAAIDPLFA